MNQRIWPNRRRVRRGNAVLETALVLFFVLIPLGFGAIEWGYVLYVKNTAQAAARETARKAILPTCTTTAEAEAAGRKVLAAAFDSGGRTLSTKFTFEWVGAGRPSSPSGTDLHVKVIAPAWQEFGMRPLGSIIPWWDTAKYSPAPAANRRFESSVVMVKE